MDEPGPHDQRVASDIKEVPPDEGAQSTAEARSDSAFPSSLLRAFDHFVDGPSEVSLVVLKVFWVIFHVGLRLVMHDRHKVVWRVAEVWSFEAHPGEVTFSVSRRPLIYQLAGHKDHQPVEQLVDFGTGLMDGHGDGLVVLGG